MKFIHFLIFLNLRFYQERFSIVRRRKSLQIQKSLKNHSLAIIKNKEISCTQFCLSSPGTMVSAACDHLGQLVTESCF